MIPGTHRIGLGGAAEDLAANVTQEAYALEARHNAIVKAAEASGDGAYKKNYIGNVWEWNSVSKGHQPEYDIAYETKSSQGLPLVTSVIWKRGQGWIAVVDVPGPSVIDAYRTKETVLPDSVNLVGHTWGDAIGEYAKIAGFTIAGFLALALINTVLPRGR